MRIQKFLIISLVVGSGASQAFSQGAASSAQQTGKPEDFFRARNPEALRLAQADTQDPLVEILRKKQAELDAKGTSGSAPASVKQPTPASKPTAPKPAAQQQKTISQPSVDAQGEERLVELLRKKQAELDAKGTVAKTPSTAAPVAKPAAPAVAPTRPVAQQQKTISLPSIDAQGEERLVELLRKKQSELDAQGPNASQAASVAKPIAAPAVAPKPAPTAKPAVAQSRKTISQPSVDAEGEARLVELLRKKQAELDAKAGIVAPAPAIAKPAEVKKPESQKPAVAVQPSKEQEESAARVKRIEAELKAKEEAAKKDAEKTAAAKTVVAPQKSKTAGKAAAPVAPALDSKEAKLAELLRKYKADEITPHDYHMERAKIIAQP